MQLVLSGLRDAHLTWGFTPAERRLQGAGERGYQPNGQICSQISQPQKAKKSKGEVLLTQALKALYLRMRKAWLVQEI